MALPAARRTTAGPKFGLPSKPAGAMSLPKLAASPLRRSLARIKKAGGFKRP